MAANQDQRNKNIQVYLRLRPLNKFEKNKRSRNVVEVIDDKRIAVENALEGDFEAELDGVFDESSSQQEVFASSCSHIPQQVLNGFNHSVLIYGATATGKTHTLVGTSANDGNYTDPQDDSGREGLVSRLASQLFDSIRQAGPAVEFIVRCSVVEIYLERIRDLLDESNRVQLDHRGNLMGCSRLSCLNGKDLAGIVERAHAVRTCSSADPNRDSSRSSFVVKVDIEQYDRQLNTTRVSYLMLCDLMGSELASTTEKENTEPAMVSRSLKALHRVVQEQKDGIPVVAAESTPVLARLLSNSIGGNSYTTFFLTASPSNYALRETTNTILFGLDCREISNKPVENTVERWQDCNARVLEAEEQQRLSESLAKALANECKRLQSISGTRLKRSIEVIIDRMLECESDNRPLRFTVETKSDHQIHAEQMRLKSDSRRAQNERRSAVSEQEQLRSDLMILQSQNASLREKLTKVEEELALFKNENVALQHRRQAAEHNLRTSQFRENEAIVFLRQIRRFYYRLLKKMVAEASGDFEQVVLQIPGAPDLTQLADIDQSMFESGLLEEDEIGRDVSVNCRPSSDALMRSTSAAQEMIKVAVQNDATDKSPSVAPSVIDEVQTFPKSVVKREEKPEVIEARQRLYSTPSGRYIAMREKMLEEELLSLSERCIQLQNKLEDERANVEALTGRGGMAGAFDRMRAASEAKALKDLLDKKDNDIKVLIWKMNELHMMGKALKSESANKDQHISYLEENFEKFQNKHNLLATEKVQREKKLREDIKALQAQIESVSVPLWHLSEHSASQIPSHCRIVAPFSSSKEDIQDPERRSSTGDIGEWIRIDLLHSLSGDPGQAGVKLDSEAMNGSVKVDVEVQTDPIEFDLPIKFKKSAEVNVVENCLFMDDSSEDETAPDGFEKPGQTELKSDSTKELRDQSSRGHRVSSGSATGVDKSVRGFNSFPPGDRSQPTAVKPVEGLSNLATPANASSSLGPQKPWKSKPTNIPHQIDSFSPGKEDQAENPMAVQSESIEEKRQTDPQCSSTMEPDPQNEPAEVKNEISLRVAKPEIVPQNAKQSWRLRLSEDNHSGSNFAGRFAHSSSTSKQPHGVSLSQFMNKNDRETNTNGPENDDEKTTTPEFLKLFRKIGSRNQGECVIEASGCAPAKAPPRTAYGEFLRQDSRHRIKEVDSCTILKPWTPKKKKSDDGSSSDDDSFAQAFIGGSGIPIGQGPGHQSDSSESSDDDAEEINNKAPQHDSDDSSGSEDNIPTTTTESGGINDDKSESKRDAFVSSSGAKELFGAAPSPPPQTQKTWFGQKKSAGLDSDDSSDSEDAQTPEVNSNISDVEDQQELESGATANDESLVGASVSVSSRAKALFGNNGAASPPPPESQKTWFGQKKSAGLDSGDSSDSEDAQTPGVNSNISDVEDQQDPESGATANDESLVGASVSVSSRAKALFGNNGTAPPPPPESQKTWYGQKKPADSDSDDSSDSSEEAMPSIAPKMTLPNDKSFSTSYDAGVPTSVPKERPEEVDVNDSDSSEEKEATRAPGRGPKPTPPKDDSESDDSSDSSQEATRSFFSRSAPSKDVSGRDSSHKEKGASAPVQKPAPPKNDSDSDDSSDSSVGSTRSPASKPSPPKVDSVSDSNKEGEAVPIPLSNPIPALTPKPVSMKTDSDSESESSSEEEEEDPMVVPRPAISKGDSDSDSESSSEEEEEAPVAVTGPASSKGCSDSDSEPSSGKEEVVPIPDPKTASSKGDPDSDSEPSSEEEEEEEVVPTPDPKKESSKGDPDSESESSSQEEEELPTPDPKKASSKGNSDSESESSSQEKEVAPMAPPESAFSERDSDSESGSSSEEEEAAAPAATNPGSFNSYVRGGSAARPAPVTGSTKDDSDSDSDDSEEETRPPFPQKRDKPKHIGSRLPYELSNMSGESRTDVSDSTWDEPSESLSFSTHSEVDPHFGEEGRPVNFSPKRKVEDYGSNVKPAVTTISNPDVSEKAGKKKYAIKGGKLVNEPARTKKKKEKTQFAIKRGKLLKTDDRSRSSGESSNEPSVDAKFVIRDGKLVKDEKELKSPRHSKSKKSGSESGDHFNVVDPVAMQSELMMSVSDEDWGQDASPRKSKRTSTNFVIKNGKLVKEEAQATSPKKASFQIVNGKLVKSVEGGTLSQVKKSPRKSISTDPSLGKSDSGKQRSAKKVIERGTTGKKPDGTHTKKKASGNTARRKSRTKAQF